MLTGEHVPIDRIPRVLRFRFVGETSGGIDEVRIPSNVIAPPSVRTRRLKREVSGGGIKPSIHDAQRRFEITLPIAA